jgi:hypothetical protein
MIIILLILILFHYFNTTPCGSDALNMAMLARAAAAAAVVDAVWFTETAAGDVTAAVEDAATPCSIMSS